jgi:hypothetical protein
LETTARYALVATGMIASIASPLDLLLQEQRKKSKKTQQNTRKPGEEVPRTNQPPA